MKKFQPKDESFVSVKDLMHLNGRGTCCWKSEPCKFHRPINAASPDGDRKD